jgi:hypothetical protein
MKFMLMVMSDEASETALPASDMDKTAAQHLAVSRELDAAGKYVGGYRLRFGRDATTIRIRDRKHVVLDGPFSESKEVLGGFHLIDVASKEEAIEWAKKLPLREVGAIEVRPARTGAQWRNATPSTQRYMLMFIANEDRPLSVEDLFRAIDNHYELSLDLAVQGKFVSSRALEHSAAATTIRQRNGKLVAIDGPFAESKEFVAGYFVIASDSKDEAIEWAKKLMLGSDTCEVRPVWQP